MKTDCCRDGSHKMDGWGEMWKWRWRPHARLCRVCVHIPPQSRHGPHYRHAVLTQQVFRCLFHAPVFQRQRRPRLMLKTNKVHGYSSSQDTCLTAMGTHMPYGITQCYLPPSRGDIPAFTPAKAGTRLSDPGGMQGWVDLVGWLQPEMVYPPEDGHPSQL